MVAAYKRKLGVKGHLRWGVGVASVREASAPGRCMWDQLGSGKWKKGPQAD